VSDAAGPMARRRARLSRRLRATRAPIVWLRAPAGSGKTRLLVDPDLREPRAAAGVSADAGNWHIKKASRCRRSRGGIGIPAWIAVVFTAHCRI